MNIYKMYLTYTHTINGKVGRVIEFSANSDAYAQGVGSSEFSKDENAHFGLLVKTSRREDVVVCSYEHGLCKWQIVKL